MFNIFVVVDQLSFISKKFSGKNCIKDINLEVFELIFLISLFLQEAEQSEYFNRI